MPSLPCHPHFVFSTALLGHDDWVLFLIFFLFLIITTRCGAAQLRPGHVITPTGHWSSSFLCCITHSARGVGALELRGSHWMDTAGLSSTKPFRTPWPCLLGCVLLCVAVCAGDQPRLLAYRPADVSRNTDGGVFVLACKSSPREWDVREERERGKPTK